MDILERNRAVQNIKADFTLCIFSLLKWRLISKWDRKDEVQKQETRSNEYPI
jgi:hypothetical protein